MCYLPVGARQEPGRIRSIALAKIAVIVNVHSMPART